MKKVMIFGTFDVFHEGHKNLIEQARKFGEYLIVVVGRDETVRSVKGKFPLNNESERSRVIKESGLAQKVVLGNLGDKYAIIKEEKPDVICLGYDQNFFVDELKSKLKEMGLGEAEVVRLKSYKPEIFKSSKLK